MFYQKCIPVADYLLKVQIRFTFKATLSFHYAIRARGWGRVGLERERGVIGRKSGEHTLASYICIVRRGEGTALERQGGGGTGEGEIERGMYCKKGGRGKVRGGIKI